MHCCCYQIRTDTEEQALLLEDEHDDGLRNTAVVADVVVARTSCSGTAHRGRTVLVAAVAVDAPHR